MSSNIIESLRELFSWKILVGIGTYHALTPYLVLDVTKIIDTLVRERIIVHIHWQRPNGTLAADVLLPMFELPKFKCPLHSNFGGRFLYKFQVFEINYAPQIHKFFYFNYGYTPQILNLII